jgi:L-aminopeptidase/D-esterase-like protein
LEQKNFTVAGVPVGMNLGYPKLYHPCSTNLKKTRRRWLYYVIIATDIASFTTQLKKIAQRIPLGVGIVGGRGGNGSGDIFLAFSAANENAFNRDETTTVKSMPDDQLMPVLKQLYKP